MLESSTLPKEVSSCRGAQLCPKSSTHAGELSSAHVGELGFVQRGQLMQESSAFPKEVSSCRRAQPQLILSDPSE